MPDSLLNFLSKVEDDEARRIWTWLNANEVSGPGQMVDVIAQTHQHIFERTA